MLPCLKDDLVLIPCEGSPMINSWGNQLDDFHSLGLLLLRDSEIVSEADSCYQVASRTQDSGELSSKIFCKYFLKNTFSNFY